MKTARRSYSKKILVISLGPCSSPPNSNHNQVTCSIDESNVNCLIKKANVARKEQTEIDIAKLFVLPSVKEQFFDNGGGSLKVSCITFSHFLS